MPSWTLAALEQRVWDSLDNNTFLYPELQVRQCLNEGLRKLNLLVGFDQVTTAIPGFSVAGQTLYSVPPNITIPIKAWFEQNELDKLSIKQTALTYRNFTTDTTSNAGPVKSWYPIGITRFGIYPADAVGGLLLEVTGVNRVTPLVLPGDVINLDDQWCDALIMWVRARIMLTEGGKPFADASACYQQFIGMVKPFLIWQALKFPRYFIERELEQAQGRGA
jgi:hypothetical protein